MKIREKIWVKHLVILIVILGISYGLGSYVREVSVAVGGQLITNFQSQSWGLGFGVDGTTPTGNSSAEELEAYNAYYVGDESEMVLYLTFDAGYENGNTEAILDALEKHDAPATFFIVGYYLEENPELVMRMIEEGHLVGNHSYNHPDMTILSEEEVIGEITSLASLFLEITGTEMAKFYRPPQGKYSFSNLNIAKEMGYTTIFWSLAYVDWYVDDQPTKEEAFDKLLNRVHPGAIVLLHTTSQTNAEILDELLTEWENMGYEFKSLEDI